MNILIIERIIWYGFEPSHLSSSCLGVWGEEYFWNWNNPYSDTPYVLQRVKVFKEHFKLLSE
jgi:hypothetical protein